MITQRVTIVTNADMLNERGMLVTNKAMRDIELGLWSAPSNTVVVVNLGPLEIADELHLCMPTMPPCGQNLTTWSSPSWQLPVEATVAVRCRRRCRGLGCRRVTEDRKRMNPRQCTPSLPTVATRVSVSRDLSRKALGGINERMQSHEDG
jgi:hypothetical protein